MSRALQRILAEEEKKRGLKQADIARTIGVDRATITRQIHGGQNMTLLRVGELASAMGRIATISFPEPTVAAGSNLYPMFSAITTSAEDAANLGPSVVVSLANG